MTKYTCQLTFDPNTVHRTLRLSEDNKEVTWMNEDQQYPDHPERFKHVEQVLCREGLSGRCYWEAEWTGRWVMVGVAYKKGMEDSRLGCNNTSWGLVSYGKGEIALSNNTIVPTTSSTPQGRDGSHKPLTSLHGTLLKLSSTSSPSVAQRIGVYLDWLSGTLSFYNSSTLTPSLLHTFHTTFTEPVYPGFQVPEKSSVSLAEVRQYSAEWSVQRS